MSYSRAGISFCRPRGVLRSVWVCLSVAGLTRARNPLVTSRAAIAGIFLILCVPALGQSATRALLEQALDEPANIDLADVRLGDAIRQIAQVTGVPIHIPPDVLDLAPHGSETIVRRIEIRDTTLRHGLSELLSPLGMTFRVSDDHVEVQLVEALRCLGRSPTWEELDTLGELSMLEPGLNGEHLDRLRTRIRFQVEASTAWTSLSSSIHRIGAGSGVDVLTQACAALEWGWCFDGRQIVVASAAAQFHQRLGKPISLRMSFRPLIEVLQALGREAGVAVRVEPGALQSLPRQVRKNFSIIAKDTSVEEILERIAAATGLGYLIEPGGVLFFKVGEASGMAPAVSTGLAEPVPDGDPYVGKVVVPLPDGRSVEWLIRRSELPPDLRAMREKALQEAFDAIRAQFESK